MFMPGRRLSFVFSLFMLFSGLQFRAIASPAMRSSASFSTIEGEKHVSVTTEGTLEISASDSAGKRSDFYRYSSAWIFLYMLPLGAEDQPDRLLTVWESPTSTTEVVVFNLLSSSHPSTGGSDQARVLLKVGGVDCRVYSISLMERSLLFSNEGRSPLGETKGSHLILCTFGTVFHTRSILLPFKRGCGLLSNLPLTNLHRGTSLPRPSSSRRSMRL
jgi:hypothetical protein